MILAKGSLSIAKFFLVSAKSKKTATKSDLYVPNFEEAGGAYCFWGVRPFVCPFVNASVRSSRFLIHSITLDTCMLLF